jgi:hypothetical protein
VGPRAGLDAVKKRKNLAPPGIEPPSSSPSLYRLSYPDSSVVSMEEITLHNFFIAKHIGTRYLEDRR